MMPNSLKWVLRIALAMIAAIYMNDHHLPMWWMFPAGIIIAALTDVWQHWMNLTGGEE